MTTEKKVKLSSLKADLKAESDGQWIPASEIGPGVRFYVRSVNYPPFLTARDTEQAKLLRKFGAGSVPTEEITRVNGTLAVEHLLLNWDGLDEPFSKEKALEILTDEAYRRLRSAVYMAAGQVGQGDVEFVEVATKNSKAPSATP